MKTKRIISVLIAVFILLSCFAITASADDAIFNPQQALTLTINLWQEGSTENSHTGIANATFTVKDSTGTQIGEPITTNADGIATFTAPKRDTYTVTQTELGTNQRTLAAEFKVDLPMTDPTDLNKFIYNVNVYPKVPVIGEKPEIKKEVSDKDDEYGQSASILSIKDKDAWWRITVTVPKNANKFTKLTVSDILDKRLINPANLSVKYNEASLEEGSDKDYTAAFSTDNRKLVVNFTTAGIAKLQDNTSIEIRYTTKIDLSQDNTIGTPIGNHTILKFSNGFDIENGTTDNTPNNTGDDTDPDSPKFDPDKPGDYNPNEWPTNPGDTPKKDDPYVWTGIVDFTKIAKNKPETTLTPTFNLYSADGTLLDTLTSTDGTYEAKGLSKGSYYLIETVAPDGYQLIGEKIDFTVGDTYDKAAAIFNATAAQSVAAATETSFSFEDTTASTVTNYITNEPATKLPVTGGMGVGAFALIGLAFAVMGGAVFFRTKKSEI